MLLTILLTSVLLPWTLAKYIELALTLPMKAPSRIDRSFDFAGQATPNQTYPNDLKAKTVEEFIPRAERAFAQFSPDPSILNTMLKRVTALGQHLSPADFAKIPTVVEDCGTAPLIWFVDAQDEELVKNGVARDLSKEDPGPGWVILPSVSHFATMQDPETCSIVLDRFWGMRSSGVARNRFFCGC